MDRLLECRGPWARSSLVRVALGVAAASIAFGVSAVGALVRRTGVTEDEPAANLGTFLGALCFLGAALLILPRFRKRAPALPESGP